MVDTRTLEQRRRIMSAVRRRDTSPELALRSRLHAAGVRGWRCDYRPAPGRPDLAWPALGVAVFVDGAFWHGHPSRHKPGRSGDYWDRKIEANVARDRAADRALAELGWTVVRIWDFQLRRDPGLAVRMVEDALARAIRTRGPARGWQLRLVERTMGRGRD